MANNATCKLPEDIETLVQEMKVDGYHLVERQQKTNVSPKDDTIYCRCIVDTPKMQIIIHSRSIDDRCYDVQETQIEGNGRVCEAQVIETEMTQEEVETFEEDWRKLWKPQAKTDKLHFDGIQAKPRDAFAFEMMMSDDDEWLENVMNISE